jgi:hypothetical protein
VNVREIDLAFRAVVKAHKAFKKGDHHAVRCVTCPSELPHKLEMYSQNFGNADDLVDFFTSCAGYTELMQSEPRSSVHMTIDKGVSLIKRNYKRIKRLPDFDLPMPANNSKSLKILKAFAFLCDSEHRENIEFIIGNLQKDIRQMRDEKHSERFIAFVTGWHVFAKTIIPIAWDGVRRFLAGILPIGGIIRKIIGLF